jgi:hypothetical protein
MKTPLTVLRFITKVLPVAIAPRGSNGEDALVDALRLSRVSAVGSGNHLAAGTGDSAFEGTAASDEGSSDSLRSKASSASLASAAVRVFLGAI